MITGATRKSAALAGLLATAILLAGACSSDDEASGTTEPTTSANNGEETTTSSEVEIPERIVAIGEEYLLADLLALGIEPVASTANAPDQGFQGLDEYDTSDIQALPATEANLELLASLEPDLIITTEFYAEQLGEETLEGISDVEILPNQMSPEELVTAYGEMFGRTAEAEDLVAEYTEAKEAASGALEGLEVSVVAVYPGDSVAAFVEGPWAVPQTLLDAGASLVPTPADAEPDRNGRAYLSEERLDLISAPHLVMLQSSAVEGDDAAVANIESNPLWTSLPAVEAGEVLVLDRLGYSGIQGRTQLIDELIAEFG